MVRIAILGGGPAGYEAALVAVELGRRGHAHRARRHRRCLRADRLRAVQDAGRHRRDVRTPVAAPMRSGSAPASRRAAVSTRRPVNGRIVALAAAPSPTTSVPGSVREGVEVIDGRGAAASTPLAGCAPHVVEAERARTRRLEPTWCCSPPGRTPADHARQRAGRGADPDLAAALRPAASCPSSWSSSGPVSPAPSSPRPTALWAAEVTLVSVRDRVLPGEDADAAAVLEEVFRRRGIEVLNGRGRRPCESAGRRRCVVELTDGRTRRRQPRADRRRFGARHRGHRPATRPASAQPRRVTSRSTRSPAPTLPGVYAAGDCTGVLPLASVAAMQGRIAMWHALGEAVLAAAADDRLGERLHRPRDRDRRRTQQKAIASGAMAARRHQAAAGDQRPGQDERPRATGFVKFFARPGDRHRARRRRRRAARESELILPVSHGGAAQR